MSVEKRQAIEKRIVRKIVQDAIDMGYRMNIDNGGDDEELPGPSNNFDEINKALFATDEEHLFFYDVDGKHCGTVFLVYGNDGWDVICDHSATPLVESILAGANALVDELSEV